MVKLLKSKHSIPALLALAGAGVYQAPALAVDSLAEARAPLAVVVGKNAFSKTYSFTVAGLSDLHGSAFSSFISGFTVSLNGTQLFDDSASRGIQFASFGLGPGTYALTFSGTGTTRAFSAFRTSFNLSPSVVPEPSTAAFALIAACALGGLAWRQRLGS